MPFISCFNLHILIFVCLHFANIQARMWKIEVCFSKAYCSSIRITLNRNNSKEITYLSLQKCFYANFELKVKKNPSMIHVNQDYSYNAILRSKDFPGIYSASCSKVCSKYQLVLKRWTYWNVEAIRSEINNNNRFSLDIRPFGAKTISFGMNSRTSTAIYLLPMEMNRSSKIKLVPTGKFWPDTVIKLKNMETSEIYSCIYILDLSSQISYHECSLINDSLWKIELTSGSRLGNTTEIKIFVAVTSSERNRLQSLTFQKLAFLPIFSAFANLGNRSVGDVKIYFEENSKPFEISKIVMTRLLTGEEYGCVNIQKTNLPHHSCKLLKSKNWLLKVISTEEHERNFSVEIFQDKLSSFSKNFTWNYFSVYGDSYIKHFQLKTYEVDEITSLKLHFFGKSLKINEISLIKNFTENKFKANGGNKTLKNLVTEFIRTAKEKIISNGTDHSDVTDIGLLSGMILFLLCINIILSIKYKKLRNWVSGVNTSMLKGIVEDNSHSMRNNVSVHTSRIIQESTYSELPCQDHYKNVDPRTERSMEICDTEIYAELK